MFFAQLSQKLARESLEGEGHSLEFTLDPL
jgi:hypothetical protein